MCSFTRVQWTLLCIQAFIGYTCLASEIAGSCILSLSAAPFARWLTMVRGVLILILFLRCFLCDTGTHYSYLLCLLRLPSLTGSSLPFSLRHHKRTNHQFASRRTLRATNHHTCSFVTKRHFTNRPMTEPHVTNGPHPHANGASENFQWKGVLIRRQIWSSILLIKTHKFESQNKNEQTKKIETKQSWSKATIAASRKKLRKTCEYIMGAFFT